MSLNRLKYGVIKIYDTTYRYILSPPTKEEDKGFNLTLYSPLYLHKFVGSISLPLMLIVRALESFVQYRFLKNGNGCVSFSGIDELQLFFGNKWVSFAHSTMDNHDFMMEELIQEKKSVTKQLEQQISTLTSELTQTNNTLANLRTELNNSITQQKMTVIETHNSITETQHNTAITNLRTELMNIINKQNTAIETQHNSSETNLRTELTNVINQQQTIENQHNTSITNLKVELTSEINQQKTTIEGQHNTLEKHQQEQLEQLQQQIQEQLKQLQQQIQEQKQQYQLQEKQQQLQQQQLQELKQPKDKIFLFLQSSVAATHNNYINWNVATSVPASHFQHNASTTITVKQAGLYQIFVQYAYSCSTHGNGAANIDLYVSGSIVARVYHGDNSNYHKSQSLMKILLLKTDDTIMVMYKTNQQGIADNLGNSMTILLL